MLTVQECLDFYYREHIAKKAVARRRAEYAIEALNRQLGNIAIYDIDIPACRDYNEDRQEEGVTESTVRRELGVLQAAARHNLKWRRLKQSELPSVELPPEAVPKKTWLFKEELSHLLEIAGKSDRRVFRFLQLAYHTASRKEAIEQLHWSQVDLSARRIDLQGSHHQRTKKRRPIVPISETMVEELRLLREKAATDFVLVTGLNIRPAFDAITRRADLEVLQKKGMREQGRLTPHVLRHSRATHLLQDGKNPWAVAGLLGDSVPTVLRVYGHVCPDYLESALS